MSPDCTILWSKHYSSTHRETGSSQKAVCSCNFSDLNTVCFFSLTNLYSSRLTLDISIRNSTLERFQMSTNTGHVPQTCEHRISFIQHTEGPPPRAFTVPASDSLPAIVTIYCGSDSPLDRKFKDRDPIFCL